MAKSSSSADRRARAARIQAQSRRAERRRSLLLIGPAVLIALLLIGSTVFVVLQERRDQAAVEAAARQPIEGVQEYPDLPKNHVEGAVDYPQTPSVGGNHAPVWTNCGFYSEPIQPEQATHALEHGAVWIGYDPALASSAVDELEKIAQANSFVLVSPVDGLEAPVVVSAWGNQLAVEDVSDDRLATFVQKYQQSPDAPEPGAPCTGGTGGM